MEKEHQVEMEKWRKGKGITQVEGKVYWDCGKTWDFIRDKMIGG